MRRDSKLKGLKSMFNRAVRKVKTFFGWRDREDEAEREALAQTVAARETAELNAEKAKRDDGGDGGGDGGGDPAALRWRKSLSTDTEEEKPKPKSGYDENGKLINYAKPTGVSDEEWERRMAEQRRELLRRKREADRQRRDADKQREQRRAVQRQREQRQRVMRAEADAKVRDEHKKESPQVKLERLRASLPPEEPPKKDDGPEFC